MKYAVIDLGSNTFHLLIISVTEQSQTSFEVLHRASYFTSLSKGGGDTILPEIFTRAIMVIQQMKTTLNAFSVDHIKVIGTAVLRKATNSLDFKTQAEEILSLPITIIDGISEARYIAMGTTLHKNIDQGTHLIMDIGGGSTEFILVEEGKTKWMQSFPLGVGVLKEMFFKDDPFLDTQINLSGLYFDKQLIGLKNELQNVHIDTLIGASGTFEALEKIHFGQTTYGTHTQNMDLLVFEQIYRDLIKAPLEKRLAYPNMPKERALLIPIGLLLIHYVIQMATPDKIQLAHFALKEGVLREMIEKSVL